MQLPGLDLAFPPVAVLFAREDSIYKRMARCDVFDRHRDARTFHGGRPVIAHPPCRAWGRLRHLAKPRPDEKALALFAVDSVRRNGGVLEHPAHSTLWPAAGLPRPGTRDAFGGWTLPVYQDQFGHPCPKATWLYIVGVAPAALPPIPFRLGHAPGRIVSIGDRTWRERTPDALAEWLFQVAVSSTTATKSQK